jgi:two-component system LytT family sensor kinase
MLSVIAVHAARRIDAIRLTQERYAVKMREREIAALATDAELRALRAQLNPHFLFNALTTIGYLIETAPQRAMDTLLRLTTILRGVLRSEGEFAPLSREIALVESYLAIEHARFEQRLHVRIDVPPECLDVCVPALLLQPLVENAVKHGIAPSAAGGEVVVAATLVGKGSGRKLHLSVTDTAAGGRRRRARPWPRGVGLASVERRLAVHYGRGAELRVHMDVRATRVEVVMPAEAVEADQPPVAGTVA